MRSQEFTSEEARQIGDRLSIDWEKYNLEEFRIGLFVELEQGMEDPTSALTEVEMQKTSKIVLAHLDEAPEYYTEEYHMFAESAEKKF